MILGDFSKKKNTKAQKAPKPPTQKQILGRIGEDCACKYLEKKGYRVVDRNYLKKWGELDIVAVKAKKIHFVEVKSVSREIKASKVKDVTYETKDFYRAEDNMHPWKLQRLARTIQSYLSDKDIPDDVDWQFDLVTVLVDTSKRLSRVTLIEDLVL